MYVSQKVRRAITISVMAGGLMLVPVFCPVNTVVDFPLVSIHRQE